MLKLMAKSAKRTKYRNRVTVVDGIRFDSAKEARRWSELKMLAKLGEVTELSRQVAVVLHVPIVGYKGINREVGRITFDFVYRHQGAPVYEDVKSPATRKNTAYRLRKRMFETEYSAKVLET